MVDLSGTGAKVPGVYVFFLAASAAFLMRCLRRRMQLQEIIHTNYYYVVSIFSSKIHSSFIKKNLNTSVLYIPGNNGDDCDENHQSDDRSSDLHDFVDPFMMMTPHAMFFMMIFMMFLISQAVRLEYIFLVMVIVIIIIVVIVFAFVVFSLLSHELHLHLFPK